MSRMLFLLALAPFALLAGLTEAGHTSGCHNEGGETVTTTMIPISDGQAGAEGLYLYASEDPTDGASGLYAETNGKPGLQVADLRVVCGEGAQSSMIRRADESLLDFVPGAR